MREATLDDGSSGNSYIGVGCVFRLDEDGALAGRGQAVDSAGCNRLLMRSDCRPATSL